MKSKMTIRETAFDLIESVLNSHGANVKEITELIFFNSGLTKDSFKAEIKAEVLNEMNSTTGYSNDDILEVIEAIKSI